MNKIMPSAHLLEMYMPVANDEPFLLSMLDDLSGTEFYKGIEMPVLFQRESQKKLREIVDRKNYRLYFWASPLITDHNYCLSALPADLRQRSVEYTKELIRRCGDMGGNFVGLPSGADPGERDREEAKKALFDSFCQLAQEAAKYPGLNLTMEPLDRYAYKKQLMGPILEVVEWFAPLKRQCPNFYLHWDSAHESLAGIDLSVSFAAALPYMAQFHLCNCITDPKHPCFGDTHMEVGRAPEFKNWGYLNVDVAADILRQAAQAQPCSGIDHLYFALEVRTHLGDDLPEREKEIREFMMAAYDKAGLEYDQ